MFVVVFVVVAVVVVVRCTMTGCVYIGVVDGVVVVVVV